MRTKLGRWSRAGCAKPLRLHFWIRSSAICIGIWPTNLDWCRRRDVPVVKSSSSRPGTRCRIPKLVNCTNLPLLLVLRDAPLLVLPPSSKVRAHAVVHPSSMTVPYATPSLQYDTAAHVFASNARYSVRYCLRLRHSSIGKSIIMLP